MCSSDLKRKDDFSLGLNSNYTLYNAPVKKDSSIVVNINQSVGNDAPKRTYKDVQQKPIEQMINGELKNMGNLSNTFVGYKRPDMIARAKATVASIQSQGASSVGVLDKMRETRAKHICEMHSKFVYAALCVIFLFIGAPMGAIVRKGGFGYPVLIAIGFFIAFIFMHIMFRKLGEQGALPAAFSVWLPAMILSAIGAFLTYKAMRDERVFRSEKYAFIGDFFKKYLKKKR